MDDRNSIEDYWEFKELSGERRKVLVSLGWPYEVAPGRWQCEIRAEEFLASPQIIYGGGPVDTLINALEVLKVVRDKSTFWDDDDTEAPHS